MRLSTYEPIAEYRIEDELRAPAPRRVRPAPWPVTVVLGCTFITILLTIFSGLVIARSIQLLWLSRNGFLAIADVTDCWYAGGREGSCTTGPVDRIVRIDYRIEGHQPLVGSAPLSALDSFGPIQSLPAPPNASALASTDATSAGMRVPDRIPVLYGYWNGGVISCPAESVTDRGAVLSIAAAMLICGLAILMFARFLRWMRRTIRSLEYGEAVIGTVTFKDIRDADQSRYFVTYGFLDSDGVAHECCERCTPDQWRSIDIGQPITVIYPPGRPSQARLYRHMPLRCAPMARR
jgi:hypothetical protein